MSKRILFFGNERLATGVTSNTPTLKVLIELGYRVAAVVVAQNEIDKSRQARHLEIAEVAKNHDVPIISPDDLIKSREQLASYGAEAAVLIAYGKLVPPEIINLFPKGIINVHPSLLPLHRGSTPLESVILSGETETGVSLMKLVEDMDAGPVFAQEKVSLNGNETKQQLANQLSELGAEMIAANLDGILNGNIQPVEQDETAATEDERISKEDSRLDWNQTAIQLEREVRAFAGWPRSRTKLASVDVIVTEATCIEGSGKPGDLYLENKTLGVHTSDGIFIIKRLIPAGKKEMPVEAFLAGYKLQ